MNEPAVPAVGLERSGSPSLVAAAGRPAAVRALDASMSLLKDIEAHPLDPGYAEAAGRRRAGPAPVRRQAASLVLSAGIAVIAVAAILALRAPQPGGDEARASLVRQVEALTAKVQRAERDNAALRQQIAAAEEAVLGPSAREDVERWEQLAGQAPVVGPGVAVSLDDAPGARDRLAGDDARDPAAGDGLVQDRDLQTVVNGLWAAGAEAVAVNGQRLTTTSAIRSAGSAILVDYRPLSPPYVVSAIGDAAALQAGFAAGAGGSYVQYLQNNYGIRASIATSDDLRLPAARAAILHYARPVEAAAASGTVTSGDNRATSDAPSEDQP